MNSPEAETSPAPDAAGRIERLISVLLRTGVTVSMAAVFAGLVLMFVHHPGYLTSNGELRRLTEPGAAFPHTLRQVVEGLLAFRGQAVVAAGLILLIATPILRVAVSIVGFAVQRDRAFVLITSFVLGILLLSFLLGKVE